MSQIEESIHELPLILGVPPKLNFSHENDILKYQIKKQHLFLLREVNNVESKYEISIYNMESGIIVACINFKSYPCYIHYDLSPNLQYFVCSGQMKEDHSTITISNLKYGTNQLIYCSELHTLKTYFDYFAIMKPELEVTICNYSGETIRNLLIKGLFIEFDYYVDNPKHMEAALLRQFLLIESKNQIQRKTFVSTQYDFIPVVHLQKSNILVLIKDNLFNFQFAQKLICLKHNYSGKILRTMRLLQRVNSYNLGEITQAVQIYNYLITSQSDKVHLIDYTTGIEKNQGKMDERVEAFEGEYYAIKNDNSIEIWTKESLMKMIL